MFINEVRDEWEGIGVLGDMFIQVAVILARVEAAVLLFHEEEWGGLGEFEGRIFPQSRFSWRKSSVAFRSLGDGGILS